MIAPIKPPLMPRGEFRTGRNLRKARTWVVHSLLRDRSDPQSSVSDKSARRTWCAVAWMWFVASAYLLHLLNSYTAR